SLRFGGNPHSQVWFSGHLGWVHDSLFPLQDVGVLEYQAPQLAAACLAAAFQGSCEEAVVLDVACGTGLAAQELQARGFRHLHGLDGSPEMLACAHRKGLYQELRQCVLGQEALPAPEGHYDIVLIVGALSEGQVPAGVVPELLRVTKPGGWVCLTTRRDAGNLRYEAELRRRLDELEQQGAWEKVAAQEVGRWEKAAQGLGYISGVVYLYRVEGGAPDAARGAFEGQDLALEDAKQQ
uniref:Methyltransferase like 27 n=1 Tax=Varanus komodoensis TaxID=61221 RepID=A0A8D2J0K0_VARKO